MQAVGLYPPGQMVELSDGSIAVSLAPNPRDLERPHVRLVAGPGGAKLGAGLRELSPIPAEMSVRQALRGDAFGEGLPLAA